VAFVACLGIHRQAVATVAVATGSLRQALRGGCRLSGWRTVPGPGPTGPWQDELKMLIIAVIYDNLWYSMIIYDNLW
jgi:hypothetical protein